MKGESRAWACTLFAFFVCLPCAGQKRKVCANAWLIKGLNCRFAVCLSGLNADVKCLLADRSFHVTTENSLLDFVKTLHDRCGILIAYTSVMHRQLSINEKTLELTICQRYCIICLSVIQLSIKVKFHNGFSVTTAW